jgi:hypothetical protein
MNKIFRTITFLIILSNFQNTFSQTLLYNPNEWDEDWAYLKFSDHFSDYSLDPDKWQVTTNFGREACVFIDSPLTYSIDDINDKLKLSMRYQPGNCYSLDGQNI